MIAVPLTKNFSWRNPPFVTIALILINVVIFIAFQLDDDQHMMDAQGFYFESELADLERQFFRLHAEAQNIQLPDQKEGFDKASEEEQHILYYMEIVRNETFIQSLWDGKLVEASDPRFRTWRSLRKQYDALAEQSMTVRYGFRPAEHTMFTWLSCMFLHGSWGHLIGNMVLLWLIGALIEYGCRHVILPVVYLLGGLAGTFLFYLLNPNSMVPLVGASGAISGIMGAFAVFYGMKRLHLFLYLGFYFNYLKFPALLLLFLWLGNELFQLATNEMSSVAYAAHIGGLSSGAIMALALKNIPDCLDEEAFAAAGEDPVPTLIENALAHMAKLSFDDARPLLVEALTHVPERIDIWQHLYTIDRLTPEAHQYHRTVASMLWILVEQPETYKKACDLFVEYLKSARPPKLKPDLYLKMGQTLITVGRLNEAGRILLALLKRSKDFPELPLAMLKLARKFQGKGLEKECKNLFKLILENFPHTNEGRIAAEQLGTGSMA